MTLDPGCLQESHANMMTAAVYPSFISIYQNFQAEFSLSPIGQDWVPDPCHCAGSRSAGAGKDERWEGEPGLPSDWWLLAANSVCH